MILRFSFVGGYFLFYSFILVLNIVGDHVVDFLLFVYVSFNPFIYVLQLRATGRPSCFQSSVRNISKYRGFLSSEVCIIFPRVTLKIWTQVFLWLFWLQVIVVFQVLPIVLTKLLSRLPFEGRTGFRTQHYM